MSGCKLDLFSLLTQFYDAFHDLVFVIEQEEESADQTRGGGDDRRSAVLHGTGVVLVGRASGIIIEQPVGNDARRQTPTELPYCEIP